MVTNLSDLCRFLAPVYEALGYPAPTAQDVLAAAVEEERQKVAALNAEMRAHANRRHERTLLRDERGSAYGEVTAEIPAGLYFNLLQNKNFGPAALGCKEGIDEVLKGYPGCRVKTVKKPMVRGFRFDRGTMQFAR